MALVDGDDSDDDHYDNRHKKAMDFMKSQISLRDQPVQERASVLPNDILEHIRVLDRDRRLRLGRRPPRVFQVRQEELHVPRQLVIAENRHQKEPGQSVGSFPIRFGPHAVSVCADFCVVRDVPGEACGEVEDACEARLIVFVRRDPPLQRRGVERLGDLNAYLLAHLAHAALRQKLGQRTRRKIS